MRTTISLDEDVAAAVERLRRERGGGVSSVVNDLIRNSLLHKPDRVEFTQRTSAMHAQLDLTNIADTLELLDGPAAR